MLINTFNMVEGRVTAYVLYVDRHPSTLSSPKGGGGGGGAESARAGFNLRELPCYLSNTYETLPLLLKFIFDAMFSQILTFLIYF